MAKCSRLFAFHRIFITNYVVLLNTYFKWGLAELKSHASLSAKGKEICELSNEVMVWESRCGIVLMNNIYN